MSSEEEVNAFLEHFGVKGMRWGVRKEEDVGGGKKGGSPTKQSPVSSNSPVQISRSKQLEAKYGKDSMKDLPPQPVQKQHGFAALSPAEKKLAIGLGGLALVGGGILLSKKFGQIREINAEKAFQENFHFHMERLKQVADTDMSYYNHGMAKHWKDSVDLPKGSIVKRLSTVKEDTIRPGGFFAAFKPDDVLRYEAELPSWWARWGYQETEGYLVNLKAKVPVKAPSGEETFNMFKDMLKNDRKFGEQYFGDREITLLRKMNADERDKIFSGLAKEHFSNFSLRWCNGYDQDPYVQKFFDMVKFKGFNALIDFNDSGNLADLPLRLLNGSDFAVSAHEFVNEGMIASAGKLVANLAMSLINLGERFISHVFDSQETSAFLAHHGIKRIKILR